MDAESNPTVRSRSNVARAALLVLAFGLGSAVVFAEAGDGPARPPAVAYLEYTTGGADSHQAMGRALPPASRSGIYGVDRLSRVGIVFSRENLVAELAAASSETGGLALLERIQHLSSATQVIRDSTSAALDAFRKAEETGNWDASREAIRGMGETLLGIFEDLEATIRARLLDSGLSGADADAEVQRQMERIVPLGVEYDYDALEQILSREIRAVNEDYLASSPRPFLVEVQAHLIDSTGQFHPVYVPGYNTVETGPPRLSKHEFGMDKAQADLYQGYEKLSAEIGESKNLGKALEASLRAQTQPLRAEIKDFLEALRAQADGFRDGLERLGAWRDSTRWEAWLSDIRIELQAAPEGQQIVEDLEGLRRDVDEAVEGLQELASLNEIQPLLNSSNPSLALSGLLTWLDSLPKSVEGLIRGPSEVHWSRIKAHLAEILTPGGSAIESSAAVLSANPGPLTDVRALQAKVDTILDLFHGAGSSLRAWLQGMTSSPTLNLVEALPTPPGQKRIDVAKGPIDTSVDFRTIKQETRENDYVRVSYRFFHGDDEIESAAWYNDFLLRDFGWSSRVVASLAFSRQVSGEDNDWKPGPAASWIAHFRRRPVDAATGLHGFRTHGWGAGLTTLTLDADPDEAVELGLAASLAVLDDRIILGYGENLQSDQSNEFWFFSLRVLDLASFPAQ